MAADAARRGAFISSGIADVTGATFSRRVHAGERPRVHETRRQERVRTMASKTVRREASMDGIDDFIRALLVAIDALALDLRRCIAALVTGTALVVCMRQSQRKGSGVSVAGCRRPRALIMTVATLLAKKRLGMGRLLCVVEFVGVARHAIVAANFGLHARVRLAPGE